MMCLHMSSSVTQVIAARLPNDDAAAVRQIAQANGVTVTDTIRALIARGLELKSDADDPFVLSELVSVRDQLQRLTDARAIATEAVSV